MLVLAEALEVNHTVTQLNLSNNQIGKEGMSSLARALKVNISIVDLDLRRNAIGNGGATALAEALKVNSTISKVHIGKNKIGNDGIRALATALTANVGVTSLHLDSNLIENEGTLALAGALRVNRTLREVYLQQNALGKEGITALAAALKMNNTLMLLDLHSATIEPDSVHMLAEAVAERNLGVLTNIEMQFKQGMMPAGTSVVLPEASEEQMRTNWLRYAVLLLDIVPGALRELLRQKWKAKYNIEWHDAFSGTAFVNGGTLPPCEARLLGDFTGHMGNTIVTTTDDSAHFLKYGDCIRFGDFTTIVKSVTSPKIINTHHIPGRIVLRDPLPSNFQQSEGFYSTVRIPVAEGHRPGHRGAPNTDFRDKHVGPQIERGKLSEIGLIALGMMLVGEKNHALMERPHRHLLLKELQNADPPPSEGEWVDAAVRLRNTAMAHATSSTMPITEYEESCAAIKLFLEAFDQTDFLLAFEDARRSVAAADYDDLRVDGLKRRLESRWAVKS
jgi:hypothetical protein